MSSQVLTPAIVVQSVICSALIRDLLFARQVEIPLMENLTELVLNLHESVDVFSLIKALESEQITGVRSVFWTGRHQITIYLHTPERLAELTDQVRSKYSNSLIELPMSEYLVKQEKDRQRVEDVKAAKRKYWWLPCED